MPYEKIITPLLEATSDDWLYSSGMGRLLNKNDIHISLVKVDKEDPGLPAMDKKLEGAYEQKIGKPVAYRLCYDDIVVEPLRFVPISDKNILVPCPYFYSLSRFGGVMMTTLERAIGLALNPGVNKGDYFGYLESIHMYVDDKDRNAHLMAWMNK